MIRTQCVGKEPINADTIVIPPEAEKSAGCVRDCLDYEIEFCNQTMRVIYTL